MIDFIRSVKASAAYQPRKRDREADGDEAQQQQKVTREQHSKDLLASYEEGLDDELEEGELKGGLLLPVSPKAPPRPQLEKKVSLSSAKMARFLDRLVPAVEAYFDRMFAASSARFRVSNVIVHMDDARGSAAFHVEFQDSDLSYVHPERVAYDYIRSLLRDPVQTVAVTWRSVS